MLKKSERLTKKQFETYFKTGKRFHYPHATIVYTSSDSLHCSVVVSKKHLKQAVKRNTLRRRVYGLLYRLIKAQGKTGVFIILMKPTFMSLPRKAAAEEISSYIATLLKKT